ncbi:hypothetical protein [Nocardioides nanhaiensis]|uniref:Uncharacterized protein n=1 Tax=Nocardioides nanhaiensis TaxID=1476871 RepID=A0ABP8W0D8_9ACTN
MTTDLEGYVQGLEQRLLADGCSTQRATVPGYDVLVARRSDFRLSWGLTRLHTFTIAAVRAHVTVGLIQDFTERCQTFATDHKGGLPRGLQTGVAVLPVLVGARVDRQAVEWASSQQRVKFACLARPVVVDAASGEAHAFRGTAMLGVIYSRFLVQRLATYVPVG